MSITNEERWVRLNLHMALIQLRRDVEAGTIHRIEYGICSNVRALLNMAHPFDQTGEAIPYLRGLCKTWQEYSGDPFFPVPFGGHDPNVAYDDMRHTLPKWSGEYGAARLRLLDFLIEQTKPQTT